MKFEFHAHLSHLGFDGVYPIYCIKESKHATNINKLHISTHKDFKDPRKTHFGQNTK